MFIEEVLRKTAEVLNLPKREVKEKMSKRIIRVLKYKETVYVVLRQKVRDLEEGTSIILGKRSVKVVRGYPPIKRVLLIRKAVPRHFVDYVVVEEKMNGYNVRVIDLEGQIIALTRGGYICPYTTSRITRIYEQELKNLFAQLGEEYMVNGEVVGVENPYTRYRYPEAPRFDFFVFEIRRTLDNTPMPVQRRREAVLNNNLRSVRQLAIVRKDGVDRIIDIISELDHEGREGVVLKDPYYRVDSLKYTTGSANISDLSEGMRFFFDEGRTYLFSRILREAFRVYELGDEEVPERIGHAIFRSMQESIRTLDQGGIIADRFQLVVSNEDELYEIISFFEEIKAPIVSYRVKERTPEGLIVEFLKEKETDHQVRKILETGISPVD